MLLGVTGRVCRNTGACFVSYGLHLQLHCCKFINLTDYAKLRDDIVTLLVRH